MTITHRAGDPCPADMFRVTPAEALLSAVFGRDVELIGDCAPYQVLFDADDVCGAAPAVVLDLVQRVEKIIDGQGLTIQNIGGPSATSAIQVLADGKNYVGSIAGLRFGLSP